MYFKRRPGRHCPIGVNVYSGSLYADKAWSVSPLKYLLATLNDALEIMLRARLPMQPLNAVEIDI